MAGRPTYRSRVSYLAWLFVTTLVAELSLLILYFLATVPPPPAPPNAVLMQVRPLLTIETTPTTIELRNIQAPPLSLGGIES